MIFLTNLQKTAYDHHENSGTDPQGWLLSSHRTTAAERARALDIRSAGDLLMADNGTIVHIRAADALFADRAEEVSVAFKQFRSTLPGKDRDPSFASVPAELIEAGSSLADDIAADADGRFAAIDASVQTNVQRSIDPTHLICKEDWSVAVALGLGLERHITGWSIDRYVTRNRQSLRGWREVSESGPSDVAHFVTLAAPDYPTARAVAREAAAWGAANVALGFAGLNSTAGYTCITRRPHRRTLPCPAPRRYVRLAEIVTGFRDGYREGGTTLQRFHALGLGARPMWPIVAAGLDWWTDISIDATSAIKDAEGRSPVLYEPEQVSGRIPVSRVAEHVVATGSLPFTSPVLEPLLDDLDLAAASRLVEADGPVTHDALRSGRPLAAALPLFANGPGTSDAGRMLVAHNYWASEVAAASVPSRGRREWAMRQLQKLSDGTATSVTVRNGATAALAVLE